MSNPSVFVTCEIKEQGAALIHEGTGSSVRKGVELLLKNDLCFGEEEVKPPPGAVDSGILVQEGLTLLVNYPFDALDISIESPVLDVRKAYKKMALKYHPDKNPRTTPLFLAIQNAHDKLTNLDARIEEEKKQRAAEADAAAKAKQHSKPPPRASATQAAGSSDDNEVKRNKEKAEQQRRRQEAAAAAAAARRKKQEEEEEARRKKEEEEWTFPIPSNVHAECVNPTTVQLTWSPPPACAYTRPPSYLRTELGWRSVAQEADDANSQGSKNSEKEADWNLFTIMRDRTEVVKDSLPAGEEVEFALRFYIQPTAENEGTLTRGEWSPPVSVMLPQNPLPPSPEKNKSKYNSMYATGSLYRRYLRSVSSLRNTPDLDKNIEGFDDIEADNWVSDEEDDSDGEDKVERKKINKQPPLNRGCSFRDAEIKWHQLMPPPTHLGTGRFFLPVHSHTDLESPVVGYVSTARKIQAKVRKGEWIFVQAHAQEHCHGQTSNNASFSGFPWGWVPRSKWIDSHQMTHVYLRPIPTSLKEVKKFKFMASMPSMSSLKESMKEEAADMTGDPVESTTSETESFFENAEEQVWYEQYDESTGNPYYYNSVTGESTWEAPEWVVEYDDYSGIRYFVKLDTNSGNPLQSKWSVPPKAFSKLIRLRQQLPQGD